MYIVVHFIILYGDYMQTVTFSEFRKHAAGFIDRVEHGKEIIITRHTKPVVKIIPYFIEEEAIPSWKKPALRLKIKGASLSKEILKERKESKV